MKAGTRAGTAPECVLSAGPDFPGIIPAAAENRQVRAGRTALQAKGEPLIWCGRMDCRDVSFWALPVRDSPPRSLSWRPVPEAIRPPLPTRSRPPGGPGRHTAVFQWTFTFPIGIPRCCRSSTPNPMSDAWCARVTSRCFSTPTRMWACAFGTPKLAGNTGTWPTATSSARWWPNAAGRASIRSPTTASSTTIGCLRRTRTGGSPSTTGPCPRGATGWSARTRPTATTSWPALMKSPGAMTSTACSLT